MKSLYEHLFNYIHINENGAAGHMLHPFDVNEFTGYDIEELIETMFGGQMKNMTEKMDGFNIQASMNTKGDVVFIRNKSNLNSEKGGMTIDDFDEQWKDNPRALENYKRNCKLIEDVFKKIGKGWFNPNPTTRRVVNCECIAEGKTNTIPYASDQVDFHNIWIYEFDGTEWKNTDITKKGIDVLDKACEGLDNVKITPNVIVEYGKEAEQLKNKWLKRWQNFIKEYDCPPDATIESIKYSIFFKWAEQNEDWITDDYQMATQLCKRWLFGDKKSTPIKDFKSIYQDHLDEFNKLDKDGKLAGDITLPLQKFFYEMGADIIKLTKGFANDSNDIIVKSLLKDLNDATEKIKKEGSLEDNRFLQKWLDVLNDIGQENLRSTEGIVFSYKGKMMKWTGGFVPLNRIIGYSKYTMN